MDINGIKCDHCKDFVDTGHPDFAILGWIEVAICVMTGKESADEHVFYHMCPKCQTLLPEFLVES